MAGAVVQVKAAVANTATTPASVTLDAPATAGNILVGVYAGDDYVTSGNRPSGFSEPTGGRQETFLGHYVWYKTAAGGETTISATPNAAATHVMLALELSGVSGLDVSNGQLAASSGTTYTTPTITPSAGGRFLVGTIGFSAHSSVTVTSATDTWLNSFVEAVDGFTTPSGATRDVVGVATLSVTADGLTGYDTGATAGGVAGTPQTRTGIILAFTESAGGGGGPDFSYVGGMVIGG